MRNLLTDLAVDSEGQTALTFHMAAAFDLTYSSAGTELDRELFRIGVSVSKYFVTKRLPNFAYECMEVRAFEVK
jgi:alkylation response protein AidB-like acyl-CoA dehydrogenase